VGGIPDSKGLQDFFRMPRSVDFGIDGEDAPVGPDDIAHPFGVLRVLPVAGAVGEPDLPRGVTEKREVVVELLGEGAILLLGIEADAENLRVLLLELSSPVAEPATFCRSAGCIGLWVEPEDYYLSEEILEPDQPSAVVLHFELRGQSAFLEHHPISARRATTPAMARSTCSIVL
jgi:hypothetical protein